MIRKLEIGRMVRYTGPKRRDLDTGEEVIIQNDLVYGDSVWVSNLNMPLCGCFSGFIPTRHLSPLK